MFSSLGGSLQPLRIATENAVFFRAPTPLNSDATPWAVRDGVAFVADARLDNSAELSRALSPHQTESDEALLFRCVAGGPDSVAHALGAFSFAHWSERTRTLTLGRDCLGNRPLFFACRYPLVFFATSVQLLLSVPDLRRDIDEQQLASYLAFNMFERRRTVYRGIERVPSRTIITFRRGLVSECKYWSPTRIDTGDEATCLEQGRALLDRATADALKGSSKVAVALSGGLDSSSVAATAARSGQCRIDCFVGVPAQGLDIALPRGRYPDEREKVEALARLHPSLNIHFVAPRSAHPFDDDPAQFFARCALPTIAGLNLGWFGHIYDAARAQGHDVVLIGVLGNVGLTWNGQMPGFGELLAGRFLSLAKAIVAEARSSGRSTREVVRDQILHRSLPAPLKRALRRLRGREAWDVTRYSPLRQELVRELGLPRLWRSQGFDTSFGIRTTDPVAHRTAMLFDRNQPARDFIAMGPDIWGVEFRNPHADRRVLEFALSVPKERYRQNGIARAFARRLLADRLPPEILNEPRRGLQVPHWFNVLSEQRAAIRADLEALQASPLASRMIDLPRLRRIADDWPKSIEEAQARIVEINLVLSRGLHVARFLRWIESGSRTAE